MKTTVLSELTLEELGAEKKKRGGLVSGYIVVILMMIGTGIYLTIRKGTGVFTFMPLVFIPIFLSIWKGYDDVKKEIKSRGVVQ